MLKRLKNSIFIIVIAAMMIGCVDQSGKTSSNQELKIAATSVAVTEILKELDVPASQVVGIPTTEAYSVPKRYKKATELGTAMAPDVEVLSTLKPDVILSPNSLEGELSSKYEKIGISSSFLNLKSVSGMFKSIEELGVLLNKEKQAEKMVNDFVNYMISFRDKYQNNASPRILILMGLPGGSYVVASESSYVGDLVKLAGGTNIYGDGNDTYIYSPIASENYIKLNGNSLRYFTNGNDVNIILRGLNQAIDKVIADEKIYGSKENLDIDGKVVKSYKTKLIIDKTNRDRTVETFVNTLKANDELVSVLAKMRNVKNSDIRNSMDNYLSKIKNELERHEKLEISLYVDNKTNDFIRAEALSKLGNISFTRKEDNKFTYVISKTEGKILTTGEFSFMVNDNKTKYTYNLYYKQTQDDKILSEGNFDLKYTSKMASVFEDVDVSNAIDYSQISELEKLAIYTKILATPNIDKFLPILEKVV